MTTEPCGTHGHFQQVESEDLKAAGVACGTSGQEEFNGLAVLGDHHMNLETIKVTLLGGGVPSDTVGSDRVCIELSECCHRQPQGRCPRRRCPPVQFFPHLSQYVEQVEKLVFDPLEATTKTDLTQHPRDVALLFEEGTRQAVV